MKMPKISIILPTYNGRERIARAIQSVRNQTYEDWELLVVDDGSTDNVAAVVSAIKDPRVRCLKNEINTGLASSLNRGLKEAKAELIARIDDDDEWTCADKLKWQAGIFEKDPEVVLAGTGITVVDESGRRIANISYPLSDMEIRNAILAYCPFAHPSVVFRRSAALAAGGYEGSASRPVEDYDLWLKLGLRGKFANLEAHCVKYLVRSGSLSRKRRKQAILSLGLAWAYRGMYPNFWQAGAKRALDIAKYAVLDAFPLSLQVSLTRLKHRTTV